VKGKRGVVWESGYVNCLVARAPDGYVAPVTVLEAIQRSTEFLARKGVESPRLQVELILAHLLGMPRMQLYLNFERMLSAAELEQARAMIKRRGEREPLQHILGTACFCGFELKVNRHVLIPRPETELLAERAWCFAVELASAGASPEVLDFGTGSGCLAIALAVHCPAAIVHAVDVSNEALAVARENAERNQVLDKISFHEGNGFSALDEDLAFNVIVTNPPYIPTAEIGTLEPEVRDFDPRAALDGGEDGLDFFRLLAREAPLRLRPGGKLFAEFGDGQAESLRALFNAQGWMVEAIENDLTSRPRMLIASAGERAR
jgi:release factor glutamine methyltransferase